MGLLVFDNDEIEVWLEADDRDERLYRDLSFDADIMPYDLISIYKVADFAPGQVSSISRISKLDFPHFRWRGRGCP